MIDLHGLILADRSANELRELVMCRTAASVPFAGRYRLIDFSLSSLQNAGVRDVGVIMQQDYQSLLDHIGSGKEWDMSRKRGGLRLLPPFGRQSGVGEYVSVIDALLAVRGYISDVKQNYIFLTRGSLAVNLDLADIMAAHLKSGADVTAVCMPGTPEGTHHRFVADENGRVKELLFRRSGPGPGVAAMEAYVMAKTTLLDIIDRCDSALARHFHRDGLGGLMETGGSINVYMHEGYAVNIDTVDGYYKANMDMLEAKNRHELFPEDRPVHTKGRADVSTYYGEGATVKNCLVADGCFIEGEVEHCVIFRGVRVEAGAVLKNCIIMQDAVIGAGAQLSNIISDKDVTVGAGVTLAGSPKLPLVVPKGSVL